MAVLTDLTPDTREPRNTRPHTSFSQISMYLRCSMQYYFAYTLGLRQRPSLPMALGSGGHAALEYNGRHKIKTGIDLAVPDMLDIASTFIDNEVNGLERDDIKPGEKVGESKDRAMASIRIYQERDAKAITPAGVEVEFDLDINEPNIEPIRIINGKIDIITTDTAVEDYKFAGKMKSQNDVDLSPQLTLYGKVFQKLTGQYPSRTGFRVFTPGNTRQSPDSRPIYRDGAMMSPERQEARFRRLANQIRAVEHNIKNAKPAPTDDPRVCSWCGFRERCQSSLVDDFEAAAIRGDN